MEHTRKQINQHKEVLPGGNFRPKVIKQKKKVILNKVLDKESREELNELWDK